MTRENKKSAVERALPVLAAGVLLAATAAVHGCKDIVETTIQPDMDAGPAPGNIGDPCLDSLESNPDYPGHKLQEVSLESQSYGTCSSGICLTNHFQGRVSCPLGQAAPAACKGPSDTSCAGGSACVAARSVAPPCDPKLPGAPQCAGGTCDALTSTCVCTADTECPTGSACDPGSSRCMAYVCEHGGSCQTAGATDAENEGKGCCAEGSNIPVSAAVCGQCAPGSGRSAAEAVYCSCCCGLAEGDPTDGGTFCTCPDGFACTELLPYFGPGSEAQSGKYCMKVGEEYTSPDQCGTVQGYFDPSSCDGVAGP